MYARASSHRSPHNSLVYPLRISSFLSRSSQPRMSLPTISYHKSQQFYLAPYGAPVTPTEFASRQQCRHYYDRVKVHVQLHHNGTYQHCEKMLFQFVYDSHSKYFVPIIKSFAHPHMNSWCTGCFKCATDEFWYRFEKASRKASHRYPSIPEDINPINTIDKVHKALNTLDTVEEPGVFFRQQMAKLQSALRHWPSIDALTRAVGMLANSLAGLDRTLLNKLGKGRICIEEDGVISIPYSACTPDVIRRVTEVVVSNAMELRDARLYEIYGPEESLMVGDRTQRSDELQDERTNRHPSLDTLVHREDSSALVQDKEQLGEPTCLFCGSADGHCYDDCPLLECLAESGVLRFGIDGSVCDYNGRRLRFESVPWCSSMCLIDCLTHRPSIETQLQPVNVYDTHHIITRTKSKIYERAAT